MTKHVFSVDISCHVMPYHRLFQRGQKAAFVMKECAKNINISRIEDLNKLGSATGTIQSGTKYIHDYCDIIIAIKTFTNFK